MKVVFSLFFVPFRKSEDISGALTDAQMAVARAQRRSGSAMLAKAFAELSIVSGRGLSFIIVSSVFINFFKVLKMVSESHFLRFRPGCVLGKP